MPFPRYPQLPPPVIFGPGVGGSQYADLFLKTQGDRFANQRNRFVDTSSALAELARLLQGAPGTETKPPVGSPEDPLSGIYDPAAGGYVSPSVYGALNPPPPPGLSPSEIRQRKEAAEDRLVAAQDEANQKAASLIETKTVYIDPETGKPAPAAFKSFAEPVEKTVYPSYGRAYRRIISALAGYKFSPAQKRKIAQEALASAGFPAPPSLGNFRGI